MLTIPHSLNSVMRKRVIDLGADGFHVKVKEVIGAMSELLNEKVFSRGFGEYNVGIRRKGRFRLSTLKSILI